MRIIPCLLLAAIPILADTCTSSGSGTWSDTSKWSGCATGGAHAPGTGDVFVISVGHTMTVAADTSVCTGLALPTDSATRCGLLHGGNGTPGKVVVSPGVHFTVGGDVLTDEVNYNPINYAAGLVTLGAGSTLTIAVPAGTSYRFGGTADIRTRSYVVAAGTGWGAGQFATIEVTGGGVGAFRMNPFGGGTWVQSLGINLAFTKVYDLGSATQFAVEYAGGIDCIVQDVQWIRCGRLSTQGQGAAAVNVSANLQINRNVWYNSVGDCDFSAYQYQAPTGLRELKDNAFDIGIGGSYGFFPRGWTITDNMLGRRQPPFGADSLSIAWAGYDGNFSQGGGGTYALNGANGPISNSYILYNDGRTTGNPWIIPAPGANWSFTGSVVEIAFPVNGSGHDLGDAILNNTNPASPVTWTVRNNISLGDPTSADQQCCNWTANNGAGSNRRFVIDHNTVKMTDGALSNKAFFILENCTGKISNEITSMKGNLGARVDNVAGFWKLQACASHTPPTDYGAPDALDYNAWSPHNTTGSGQSYANEGNGYLSAFSATPGAHDTNNVTVRWADPTRSFPFFDSVYLGHVAADGAWATGTAYTAGQVVSHAVSTYYGNRVINYRCYVAHTSDTGTEPGAGATWRDKWEFASLQALRNMTAAGTRVTDGAIGCVACKPVRTLINWIRRGFTPTNLALWRKADPTLCGTLGISATCTPGAVQMDPNQPKMGWAY